MPNLGDEVGKSATQSTRNVSSTDSVSTSYGPAGIADKRPDFQQKILKQIEEVGPQIREISAGYLA